MIDNNIHYISIKEVLLQVLDHPMLQDVTLEQAIRYTLQFITKFGFNNIYEDKEVTITIDNYRAVLPCDLVRIIQVKNKDGICLRSMTDSFNPNDKSIDNSTYKVQGNIIFTSFKDGDINIAYKAIPVDENGFPLLIDNPLYIETLELYIKNKVFTILFDQGKLNQAVLQNAQQQYAFNAGQLQSEFTIPDYAEMESIKNQWCNIIQNNNHFLRDFNYNNYQHLKIKS